jgi:hydroxymethylbilane synthase
LTGLVAAVDGSRVIKHSLNGPAASAEGIGVELAEILLSRGADGILKNLTRAAP